MTAPSRWLAPLKPGTGMLLWGEHLRTAAAVAGAWGAARTSQVLVVDAANRFDPYRLVREALRYRLAAREVLSRVRVVRAFTSHQLVRLLQEIVPPQLTPGSLVLILGPVSLFYDEQVPWGERRRLFQDLCRHLDRIKTRSALLLMQTPLPRGATNRHFGRALTTVLDYVIAVGNHDDLMPTPRRQAPAGLTLPADLDGAATGAGLSRPQRGGL